ncbi:hypothetical protein BD311DRAFT_731651 [Dichomitus squalens]|uniref:F-box domain-containing protein n=1 Tax=Dichomitus squalens TaxID=114155 RepID=A0A4Q9MAK8_9APHY|nr:hypothetical protein BD311DRAFT_731651 [Dichomitus squalens]
MEIALGPTGEDVEVRSGVYHRQPQPGPPPLPPSSSSPMPFPIRLSHVNSMTPIHSLPVELLTRIFQLGVDSQPAPDDRDPCELTFEVTISHVCRHWRNVALHTPHLWTTIHFRTTPHMTRGNTYLARNARLPIDIYVDTCSEDAYAHRQDLLFREQFIPVFNIVLPHIDRWRELHLKVADLECKAGARKVLNTCGSAPILRTLQLWHVQNWQTPERLFTAIGPPPVVVFAGHLPSLKHIILQGVNLPWVNSPFLRNLTSIEYALHSDDVRMPFPLWRTMLAASPALERLSLHYSGPRARASGAVPPDGIEWWGADPPGPDAALAPGHVPPPSAAPVLLPCLQEIQLNDLESDYLIAVFKSIDAPNLRSLYLELDTEEQDFSPFVEFLASSPRRGASESSPPNGDIPALSALQARPKFARLEKLIVNRLVCSAESWKALLESLRALTRLEADLLSMHEGAFGVLFGTVRSEPPQLQHPHAHASPSVAVAVTGNGIGSEAGEDGAAPLPSKDKGKAKASEADLVLEDIPILPALREIRCAGVSSKEVARLAAHRRACGPQYRIRRWEVEEAMRDDDGLAFERELERVSAQWREEEHARERREGRVREPWRWDEPVEKVVWYKEEGDYDEEDEEEETGDEDEYGEDD